MTASVTVWDQRHDPPDTIGEVLSWRSYAKGASGCSVPLYLEDHAERLRAKYLAFIHDLGEARIDGKRIVDHLDLGDGFSFWWTTHLAVKSPFKSPRIYDCLRLLALEEILLDRRPSLLTLHSSDRDLAQAVGRMCRHLRIAFAWQRAKQRRSVRERCRALPYWMQGLISLRHLVPRWSLRKAKRPQWFSGQRAVFVCSYFMHLDQASCARGEFHSRLWETLPKHLHDSGRRINWIQHFMFSSAVPDVGTGLDWLRRFNLDAERQGCHLFLETYLTFGLVLRLLKHWLWLNVVAWRLRNIQSAFYPKASAVWLWPMLRGDWLASLNGPVGVSHCLSLLLLDAALKDIPHQPIGLYPCENLGWERALLHAWRKHGHGRIIGVPHTTVPFWHLTYFDDPRSLGSTPDCVMPLPDRLAVNGPMAWSAFAEAGYPVERLVKVEALRYLHLLRLAPRSAEETGKRRRTRAAESVSCGTRVLVLGDMVPEPMHNFLRLLEDAVKLLSPGYTFTFKPHPGHAVNLADYPGLQVSETTEPLDQLLVQHDLIFSANSTTASVEAYVAGLPVAIGLDVAGLNLSPLRHHLDVRFVSSSHELAEYLRTAAQGLESDRDHEEFFFLDATLPRWERLLSCASRSDETARAIPAS